MDLISSDGIQLLPEKLGSIKNMPAPWSTKEVKQFLGLAGYYHKFVPWLSDLSRPLTRLTQKDILFEWTKECHLCFKLLKETLCTHPILWYPDPNRPYVLFTDASKYGWAGDLTQPYKEINKFTQSTTKVGTSQKKTVIHHPVSYISGLFRGSQLNWAALTKEAYAIYMSVRKLSFYLTNADVLIRSDHLPLKKFLRQNTMNTKVNNWAVELESYNLKFKYIQGIKNTLTDTLSRLLEIDPDAALPAEPPGTEFGYNFFEELPPVEVGEIIVEGVELKPNPDTFFKEVDLTLPLKSRSIRLLEAKDAKISNIHLTMATGR